MSVWKFKKKAITDVTSFPEGCVGFVYKITHKESGKFYIGKKQLWFTRNVPTTKKEKLAQTTGRKKLKKKTVKESDWLTYYGSSKTLTEQISLYGKESFDREILQFAQSKKQLSFLEVKWQFKYAVLEVPSFNDNILGKFFRKDC